MADKPVFDIKINVDALKHHTCDKGKQILGPRGKCCCNCVHQFAVHGHPWMTGTSIMTPTGIFVCKSLHDVDNPDQGTRKDKRNYTINSGHGLCEMWEKKP